MGVTSYNIKRVINTCTHLWRLLEMDGTMVTYVECGPLMRMIKMTTHFIKFTFHGCLIYNTTDIDDSTHHGVSCTHLTKNNSMMLMYMLFRSFVNIE